MLKKSASFALGSSKSSTYPRGYVSGFDSPAALLDGLFEHPADYSVELPYVLSQQLVAQNPSFTQTSNVTGALAS
jgi:hypothetical protein